MYKSLNTYILSFILIVGLYLIYILALGGSILPSLVFSLLPAILILCVGLFKGQMVFYAFFVINYLIMGLTRYFTFKAGIIMLGLGIGLLALTFIKNFFHPYDWKRSLNFLAAMWSIWFIYCFFELFNPVAVTEAWCIAIPNYAYFPLLCALLVPIFFTRYKDIKKLLLLWAILSLLAAIRGYWQRNHGFDPAELRWLFAEGGASTHLISSGIRYFSFFTDAAAYGMSMGLSATVFGIVGFYVRPIWQKIFFWGCSFSSFYGLMISGTRSAVVIPIVGLIIYLILCKNVKHILVGGGILVGSLFFLTQTEIGNGNALIRRMRSTFDYQQDASYQLRVTEKRQMSLLLKEKPFGIGLGLSGRSAKRFQITTPLAKYHPNSTHTARWIETGIVGLILYFVLLFLVLLKATYTTIFVIKDKKIRGIMIAFIAGISGVLVAEYANTASAHPNEMIMSILYALLFTLPYFDKTTTIHEATT